MDHLPRQTIPWVMKETSTNLKEYKSYSVYSLIIIESNKKSMAERQQENHLKIKQHTFK